MAISSLASSALTPVASSNTAPAKSSPQLNDQFMKLLVAQLTHQDPLDPVSDGQFVTQMAQIQSLQSMQQLNSTMADMLFLQELSEGSNLIGKKIAYTDPSKPTVQHGAVDSVNVANGKIQLMIGGNAVSLQQVSGVEP